MLSTERKGEVYSLLVAILESWFPILTIVILSSMGALFAYAFSMMVASLFFMIYITYSHSWREFLVKEAYRDLLWVTFYITLLFILMMTGLKYTTSGNMSVIITLQLFFSYLYFNVFGSEKMEFWHSIGAFLMGIGAIIILFPENFSLNKGDGLILLAAIIAPITALYQRRARVYVSTKIILAFRNIVALPFILLFAYLTEEVPALNDISLVWWAIVLNGVLVFSFSKILFVEALQLISITKLMSLVSFMPLFTLFFAYVVLGEVPSLMQMLGTLPILLGSYLLTREKKVNFYCKKNVFIFILIITYFFLKI